MDSFVAAVCALSRDPQPDTRNAANAYLERLQESSDALGMCASVLAQPGHEVLAALSETDRENVGFFAALVRHSRLFLLF